MRSRPLNPNDPADALRDALRHPAFAVRSGNLHVDGPPDISGSTPGDSIPSIGELIDFLMSGGRVGLIIGPLQSGTSSVLSDVTAGVQGRIYRVGNALKAKLSLSRIMVQVGAPDDGEDDATQLSQYLTADGEGLTILAIDDAHTLDNDALRWLCGLAGRPAGLTGITVILAGRPELIARLDGPEYEMLRDPKMVRTLIVPNRALAPASPAPVLAQETALFVPEPPPPLSMQALSSAAPPPVPETSPRSPVRPGRRRVRVMVAAAVLLGAGGIFGIFITRPTGPVAEHAAKAPGPPLPPQQSAAQGTALEPTPETAPDTASDRAIDRPITPAPQSEAAIAEIPPEPFSSVPETPLQSGDALRQDLRAFLLRSGRSALARDPVRFEAFFQDYLQWRAAPQR